MIVRSARVEVDAAATAPARCTTPPRSALSPHQASSLCQSVKRPPGTPGFDGEHVVERHRGCPDETSLRGSTCSSCRPFDTAESTTCRANTSTSCSRVSALLGDNLGPRLRRRAGRRTHHESKLFGAVVGDDQQLTAPFTGQVRHRVLDSPSTRRDHPGRLVGVVSVDEPHLGRVPVEGGDDDQLAGSVRPDHDVVLGVEVLVDEDVRRASAPREWRHTWYGR